MGRKCALNWLAENYQNYKGKVVEIDDAIFYDIQNSADKLKTFIDKDGTIYVKARMFAGKSEDGTVYPETFIKMQSYARRNFISHVIASDVPGFGFKNDGTSEIVYLQK